MGSEKSDHRRELVGVLRYEGGCLCGFGTHICSYLYYWKEHSERSNNIAKCGCSAPGG